MRTDDVLHDGQPKTGATRVPFVTRAGAIKLLKNAPLLAFRNPDPLVGHPEKNEVVPAPQTDPHASVALRVFDRIVHQVQDRLFQGVSVPCGLALRALFPLPA